MSPDEHRIAVGVETVAIGHCRLVCLKHTIAAGEFPLEIADEYEITVQELTQANLGNRAFAIFAIGGTIVIPPNC